MEAVAEKNIKTAREGKYLTFVLSGEEYGIEILKVREIIGLMDITSLPQTPDHMKGVINLRGKVIPVVDLRLKFLMPEHEHTEETCTIVVEVGNTLIGIIVDSVSEVSEIGSEVIEETPQLGQDIDANFIMGMGNLKEKLIILLDIDKVLSGEELEMMEEVAEN